MSAAYEARVISAHLPNRTVAFVFPEEGIPFAGGMFRIERVRSSTAEDETRFPYPERGNCPLCGQRDEDA